MSRIIHITNQTTKNQSYQKLQVHDTVNEVCQHHETSERGVLAKMFTKQKGL